MLSIYNSLTRSKQGFVPLVPGKVSMYVCGMTVYDYCHLGHARVMVVFDMVKRWFEANGYEVIYVRNITDIDDKIIRRARENNESVEILTSRFITAMEEDARLLGVVAPSFEPRATQHIDGMIAMIELLVKKGIAYAAANGDVYYAVHRFPDYGKLSGKSLDDLRAGERVAVDVHKKDPLDFVLWKAAKPDEPQWHSPWGQGRPGWHIECSAMSAHHFGKQFDIHGGGQDLQFPHHENEIAQSEGAHDHSFVNYWMHNGFVRVDNEKMSKSLGNFFTVREILLKFHPEVLRFFILRAHYHSPLNYSDQHLEDARNALTRLYTSLKGVVLEDKVAIDWNDPVAQRFMNTMNDDFNTPEAVAVLFELASEVNKTRSVQSAGLLKELGGILGLLQQEPQQYLQFGIHGQFPLNAIDPATANPVLSVLNQDEIEQMIEKRLAARKAKDFAEADRIRKQLSERGIILEDNPQGTTWRRQ